MDAEADDDFGEDDDPFTSEQDDVGSLSSRDLRRNSRDDRSKRVRKTSSKDSHDTNDSFVSSWFIQNTRVVETRIDSSNPDLGTRENPEMRNSADSDLELKVNSSWTRLYSSIQICKGE